jgi:hypothetical protein
MWQTKIFKFPKNNKMIGLYSVNPYEQARIKATKWYDANIGRYQIEPIYVNNAIGFQYRPLKKL